MVSLLRLKCANVYPFIAKLLSYEEGLKVERSFFFFFFLSPPPAALIEEGVGAAVDAAGAAAGAGA